jgi:hypothetical protein
MSSDDSSTSELQSPIVSAKAPKQSIPIKASVPTKPLKMSAMKQPKVTIEVPRDVSKNTEESLFNKLKDSKNIKYIIIGVLLLGAVVYYVYTTKYKKDTTSSTQLPKLPVPKQNPSDAEVQGLRRQLLQQQQESNQLVRDRQQLLVELDRERMNSQMNSQMNGQRVETFRNTDDGDSLDLNLDMQNLQQEKPKRKLKHPNDNNVDIDNIQAGESPVVAQHNLTQAEMEEISSKLSKLG